MILSALSTAWSLVALTWIILMAPVAVNDGNWTGWSSVGAVALGLLLWGFFYRKLSKFPVDQIKRRIRIGGPLFLICFGAAMLLELSHVAR